MQNMSSKIDPGKIKFLLENNKDPLLFRNFLKWEFLQWNLDDWLIKLGDETLPFRQGKFEFSKDPQWEKSTAKITGTFKDFLVRQVNESNEWFYFDYKYLKEWFLNIKEFQEQIKWEAFGYPNLKCDASTIWIGSKGAHTPCHIDTYGFNIVAQVYGRKRWLLFPPGENLLPTRIPYEESSIYSKINFFSPDENLTKGLKHCRMVVLAPGDVLFVPQGWWHYVENLELSISINTWIPLPSDHEKRLEEAIVQTLISQFIKDLTIEERNVILQPNEDNALLHTLQLKHFTSLIKTCCDIYKTCTKEVQKIDEKKTDEQMDVNTILNQENTWIIKVPELSDEEFQDLMHEQRIRFRLDQNETNDKNTDLSMMMILEAITAPNVVNTIKSNILGQ